MYMYMNIIICVARTCGYTCTLLLSNQNFKGPYLEAEVIEEVIGWLGLVDTTTANKFVARP